MKKNYSKATVEVIEFHAEKGFASSYVPPSPAPSHTSNNEEYNDGSDISWDF